MNPCQTPTLQASSTSSSTPCPDTDASTQQSTPSPSLNPSNKSYKSQTTSYNLEVLYSQQDNSIEIMIQDYTNWNIYKGKYTQNDIGKVIDRKMDICDLFLAFLAAEDQNMEKIQIELKEEKESEKIKNVKIENQSEQKCKEEQVKNQVKHEQNKIQNKQDINSHQELVKEYQRLLQCEIIQTEQKSDNKLGQIVKNGDILCYKIDKGGIITIYKNYYDRRTKSQTIHSTILPLPHSTSLSPHQIFLHKSKHQNQSLILKFTSQLHKLHTCNKKILQTLLITEEQNKKLKQQNGEVKKCVENMRKQMGEWKKKIVYLGEKFEKCSMIYREEGLERKFGLEKMVRDVQREGKERVRGEVQAVRKEMLGLVELFEGERQQNCAEQSKLKKQLFQIRQRLLPFQLTSLPQPTSHFFQTHNLTLTYIGKPATPTSYIYNHTLSPQTPSSYKLKIIHSPTTWIMLGIIGLDLNQSKKPLKQYSYANNKNVICYYSSGQKYPSGEQEGIGFKEGDVVEVEVDAGKGRVRWVVEGDVRAEVRSGVLGDKSKVFRPFVQMYYAGDVVEWCQ